MKETNGKAKPDIVDGAGAIARPISIFFLALSLALVLSLFMRVGIASAGEDGPLSVDIISAYNLVVDSNVESPSTYAPSVATVIGEFCNTSSTTAITQVWGYIGDYTAGTPGVYPSRAVNATFVIEHPALDNALGTGSYSLTHHGGSAGLTDASRYIGTIEPGQCHYEYWHFTYPQCEINPDGTPDYPPCENDPAWGDSVKPDDDLWLNFDIWATGTSTTTLNAGETREVTMRNEISAMANKIEPNGNPGGRWFNTEDDQVRAGDIITSNGVNYTLGNVRFGFDNDGDLVPDYNAWLQPIGDTGFDPACFRLIRTSGVLTVTSGGGTSVITFTDQLYFTNLPPDNTAVDGLVYYTFQAISWPCQTSLTPYQEVASGFDNEKFNGDFGTGIPGFTTTEPEFEIDKQGNITVTAGSTIDYVIEVPNTGSTDVGLTLASGAPLVISDTIPEGTTLVTSTLDASQDVMYLFSIDGGDTWTTTMPSDPSTITNVQWWLSDTLAASSTAGFTFSVNVPGTYSGDPFIENCASAGFGGGPGFLEDCAITMVEGDNMIGDYVWRDEDADGRQDGGETGINDITVSLYWDKNGDGVRDGGDQFVVTTTTYFSGTNGYYSFDNLPDGDYLVVVDGFDPDLPYGYNHTTAEVVPVTGLGTTITSPYLDADFGFGPVLFVDKERGSGNPIYEGDTVTYTIELVNTRPGDGTGEAAPCVYTTWGADINMDYSGAIGSTREWSPSANAYGESEPDGYYASSEFANVLEDIGITSFAIGSQPGTLAGVDVLLAIDVVNPGRFNAGSAESLDIEIIDTNNTLADDSDDTVLYTQIYTAGTMNTWGDDPFTLQFPLSSAIVSGMSLSDFNGSRYLIHAIADGGGGNNTTYNAYIDLDAVAFQVTTDQACGGSRDTIATLPMTDTFDADLLQFVSATPPSTGYSTQSTPYANTGVISWANLGPLYAGQTKMVTVTFIALEPSVGTTDNTATTVTNTVTVNNAAYANGKPVNRASDWVTNTLAPTGSIGDFVWRDIDGDGVQDGGTEVGIGGVVITLTADVTITINGVEYAPGTEVTTTTSADGYYLFEGLRFSGSYTVTVDTSTLPVGSGTYTNTYDYDNGTTNPNNETIVTLDHDATDGSDEITYADFGYQVPSLIEGTIWNDWDQSGTSTPDPGEDWLTNVTVTLYDSDGNSIATTTTDENGYFQFIGNYTGTYTVTVTPGTGDMSTGTWTQSFDSDDHTTTPHEVEVTVVTGGSGRADYSYYQTGSYSLGDTVFADWDGDGSQDTNEEGLPGVTVFLYEDTDNDNVYDPGIDAFIMTATTTITGYYEFEDLPDGNYVVVVGEGDIHPAYEQTADPDQSGTCTNCDGQGGGAISGADDMTVDFGYMPVGYGSIGDYVWEDTNGDGLQGVSETGIPTITVWLEVDLNGDGTYTRVMTTTTDSDGYYSFDNLPPANYRVVVDTLDDDLPTMDPDGTGPIGEKPYVPSTPTYFDVTLDEGEEYLDADFGFTVPGSIGDTIYWDANRNGDLDWNENGIAGVVVTLTNASTLVVGGVTYLPGEYITTTTTAGDGYYIFTGLYSSTYNVTVGPISGDPTLTGDPDTNGIPCTEISPGDYFYPFCDGAMTVNLPAGRSFLGADFGYDPPGVIGDYVWLDADRDGVQDSTELGIGGVVITLTASADVTIDGVTYSAGDPITTTTDYDGYYYFSNLPDATYTVTVSSSTLPTVTVGVPVDATYEYNNTVSADGQVTLTISSGAINTVNGDSVTDADLDIDFGYDYPQGTYELGGTTFYDNDQDGGLYEPGTDIIYPNVQVYLWMEINGTYTLIDTAVTTATGTYTFTGLYTGTYRVSTSPVAPGGEEITTASIHTASGITLNESNPSSPNNDFGFYGEPYPTGVDLVFFRAVFDSNRVVLTWQTATEWDLLGFNIYRATSPAGPWYLDPPRPINESMISPRVPGVTGMGAAYQFIDEDVEPNVTYYYLLEDIHIDFASGEQRSSYSLAVAYGYRIFLPLVMLGR
jgi:uncharacterized repeat protein (TIGR01451 family)